MYQIETKQHLNGNLFAFDQNSDKLRKQSGKLKILMYEVKVGFGYKFKLMFRKDIATFQKNTKK